MRAMYSEPGLTPMDSDKEIAWSLGALRTAKHGAAMRETGHVPREAGPQGRRIVMLMHAYSARTVTTASNPQMVASTVAEQFYLDFRNDTQ